MVNTHFFFLTYNILSPLVSIAIFTIICISYYQLSTPSDCNKFYESEAPSMGGVERPRPPAAGVGSGWPPLRRKTKAAAQRSANSTYRPL
jgi:hypothetical protein